MAVSLTHGMLLTTTLIMALTGCSAIERQFHEKKRAKAPKVVTYTATCTTGYDLCYNEARQKCHNALGYKIESRKDTADSKKITYSCVTK